MVSTDIFSKTYLLRGDVIIEDIAVEGRRRRRRKWEGAREHLPVSAVAFALGAFALTLFGSKRPMRGQAWLGSSFDISKLGGLLGTFQ